MSYIGQGLPADVFSGVTIDKLTDDGKANKELTLSNDGQLIGVQNNIQPDDIDAVMIDMHDNKQKITIRKLSELLDVSSRTVYRVMCDDLRREKELLNIELKKIYEKV